MLQHGEAGAQLRADAVNEAQDPVDALEVQDNPNGEVHPLTSQMMISDVNCSLS
jgi:hypothetical protein